MKEQTFPELKRLKLIHRKRVLDLECPKDGIFGFWNANTFWEHQFLFWSLGYFGKEAILSGKDISERVIIDCGANVGNHSIFWSGFVKKVYAFEGNPRTAKILIGNVERNKLNIKVISAPVGNGERVRMRDTSYLGSDFQPDSDGEMISVRLDDYDFETVDLLKLDVEGAELRALQGAKKLIERDNPLVAVEVHQFKGLKNCEILDFCKTLNFDINKRLVLKSIGDKFWWKDGKWVI